MLVRRRIQTPSVAKVRSAVQREEEVVLGASPPARRPFFGAPYYLPLASAASFVTVFQLRVVPATPSCFSKYALLSLDLP